jgi:Na+/proline symporter
MEALKKFSVIDYGVFIAMLSCCSIVGLYFGFEDLKRRKQKLSGSSDVANYLMGGRQMLVFPVALSLIASLVSGVLLLGK